jgi:hypothetical protein
LDGNKRSFACWGDFGIATDICLVLFLALLIFYKYLEPNLLHKMAGEDDCWQLDSAVTRIRGNLPSLLFGMPPVL